MLHSSVTNCPENPLFFHAFCPPFPYNPAYKHTYEDIIYYTYYICFSFPKCCITGIMWHMVLRLASFTSLCNLDSSFSFGDIAHFLFCWLIVPHLVVRQWFTYSPLEKYVVDGFGIISRSVINNSYMGSYIHKNIDRPWVIARSTMLGCVMSLFPQGCVHTPSGAWELPLLHICTSSSCGQGFGFGLFFCAHVDTCLLCNS